jgi:hypothetical protein
MKMGIADYMFARNRIWGDEAHNLTIVWENGRYYADCESTLDRRRLTDTNYENVLHDMFYDYCVENADWMGVS